MRLPYTCRVCSTSLAMGSALSPAQRRGGVRQSYGDCKTRRIYARHAQAVKFRLTRVIRSGDRTYCAKMASPNFNH